MKEMKEMKEIKEVEKEVEKEIEIKNNLYELSKKIDELILNVSGMKGVTLVTENDIMRFFATNSILIGKLWLMITT